MQAGEESAGGDHPQNSMGQLARLLGRPKSFAGREYEWHDLESQVRGNSGDTV